MRSQAPRRGLALRPMVVASAVGHGFVALALAWGPQWMPKPVRPQAYQVRLVSLPVEEPKPSPPRPEVTAPRPEPPRAAPKKTKVTSPSAVKAAKKSATGVVAPGPVKGPRPAVAVVPDEPAEPPAPEPRPAEPASKPAPDQTVTAVEPGIVLVTPLMEAVALKFPYYMNALVRKMDANWSPPGAGPVSAREVLVTFTILRDGSVRGAQVEQSSGDPFYDQAALRSVQRSTPFPPLPPGYPDETMTIHFSFLLDPDRPS